MTASVVTGTASPVAAVAATRQRGTRPMPGQPGRVPPLQRSEDIMTRILTGRTDDILARIAAFEGDELAARELDIAVADKAEKHWFVAVGESGETLGFCSAVDDGERVGFWTFYVPPASRGTGVGRELWLARLDAYAGRELYAYCSKDSWPFYERSGFVVVTADYETREHGLVWWAEVRRPA